MKKKILWTILVIILASSLLLVGCSSSEEEEEGPRIVELGEYPQTIKAADVTITETIEEDKIYLGSDGAYYAKVTADPYNYTYDKTKTYTFSDGTVIEGGATYYFKYEPIKWRVLQEKDDGTALVLSEKILDAHKYSGYYKTETIDYHEGYYHKDGTPIYNYAQSDIREFLTETFCTSAFTKDADIQRIKKENGRYGDMVFLLEQYDAKRIAYGFINENSKDPARVRMTTDYSRAVGVEISIMEDNYGAGSWWLGSSYKVDDDVASIWREMGIDTSPDSEDAACVDSSGWIKGNFALGKHGVVPAMWIVLP